MEDYLRTIQEFEERFSTEEGCRAYLVSLRWPDGFRCPLSGIEGRHGSCHFVPVLCVSATDLSDGISWQAVNRAQTAAIAVSEEPESGSPAPTTKPFIVAPLAD